MLVNLRLYINLSFSVGLCLISTKNIIKQIPENVTIILVPDTRHALAIATCNYYNNPSRKFKLIGVTGTKGKTTTTYMIKNILEKNGTKVGLIGTIANYIGSRNCFGRNSRE